VSLTRRADGGTVGDVGNLRRASRNAALSIHLASAETFRLTMRHCSWPAVAALSGGSARATISTAPSTRTATAMYWRPAFV